MLTPNTIDSVKAIATIIGWFTVIPVAIYVGKFAWTVRGLLDKAVSNHLAHIQDSVTKVQDHIDTGLRDLKEDERRNAGDIVKAVDRWVEVSERHHSDLVRAIYEGRKK